MTEQRGLDSFARVPLLFGPSPMHRLERLSEHLGGEVEIWAKREDCNSGLAHGGNKTRKLEYVVADALAQGCDTLVLIGGVQSNYTRQVAAGRREARPQLCPGAGALGRVAGRVHDKLGTRPSRGLRGYSQRSASRSAASTRRCSRRSTWRLGVRVVRHIPLGSKRMCANFETYASSGTPYCNP